MPTREQMIAEIRAAKQSQPSAEPTRKQMIAEIRAAQSRSPNGDADDGLLGGAARGLQGAITTYDSYMGAPVRAGIGALQDGKGVGGALGAFGHQFGEDPSLAPHGSDIRKKAGINLGDETFMRKGSGAAQVLRGNPMGYLASEFLTRASPNDVADAAIEGAADLSNALPVAKVLKGGVKLGVEGLSGAIRGTARATDAAFNAGAKVGRLGVHGVFGVPEETITRYMERHPILKDKVGARAMMEETAGKLSKGLEPLMDRLDAAEAAVATAKEKRSEDLAELLMKRQEANEALKRAREQVLGESASRVASHVQQLSKGVSEGSAKSFSILDKEGVRVPVTPLKSDLTKGINAMRPVTNEQVAVVDLLKGYRERLDQFGKDMPGGEAKRIIQSLDREMRHLAPGEVGRLGQEDQVLGILRRRFDAPLKASDEYAKQMKGVAKDTGLLKEVGDLASESSAARAIMAAQKATGADKAALLKQLGERYGQDFVSMVERGTLPESSRLAGIKAAQRAAKRGDALQMRKAEFMRLKEQAGAVPKLTKNGVSGIVDNINSYVRAGTPSSVLTEDLVKAGDHAGLNMMDDLKDIKAISSFEKGYSRGSANTNMWGALIGGIVGSVAGPIGTTLGVAGGGVYGRAIMDNFGPAIGRRILDAAPMLKKMNPSEWIRALDVPVEVKHKLVQELAAYRQIDRGAKGAAAASKPFREVGSGMSRVAGSPADADRDPSSEKIKPGTIRDGRIYYGGDQNDQKNWKLLKKGSGGK